MRTPLVNIDILSIYTKHGERIMLPARMARCTPDTHTAIISIAEDVRSAGGKLYLSDLFRSYDMQLQAHMDWQTGKKRAYSPPPGGSLHEAGRAFDISLDDLGIPLARFWEIASAHGVKPVIDNPDRYASEAWHFESRGSHAKVREYYKAGKGTNFGKPYQAMAASCIMAIGVSLDKFGPRQDVAYLQSCLVRLGYELGSIDGYIGAKTNSALQAAGIGGASVEDALVDVEAQLQDRFPDEFRIQTAIGGAQFEFDEPPDLISSLPPKTVDQVKSELADPRSSAYMYIGDGNDDAWLLAISIQGLLPALRLYRAAPSVANEVRDAFSLSLEHVGVCFGFSQEVKSKLSLTEAGSFSELRRAITDARA